jgi:hypothetical protein
MKSVLIIYLLLLFPIVNFSQSSIKDSSEHKFKVSLKIGFHYKYYLGNKIEPQMDDLYGRHIMIPTFGYCGGLLFTNIINKHWHLSTGIVYCMRKDKYKNSHDSISHYGSLKIIEIYYSNNNLEIPLFIEYKFKNIILYGGINLTLLNYRKATYTYENNFHPQITLKELEMPLTIYPTFQISYDLHVKNIALKPFLGFNIYRIKFSNSEDAGIENSFFIQGGVLFPLKI